MRLFWAHARRHHALGLLLHEPLLGGHVGVCAAAHESVAAHVARLERRELARDLHELHHEQNHEPRVHHRDPRARVKEHAVEVDCGAERRGNQAVAVRAEQRRRRVLDKVW